MMTLEEEGAYIRLLAFCWEHGTIPSDPEACARLIGKGASTTLATKVQAMFNRSVDGSTMRHLRLDEERRKQALWSEKSAAGGRKSAEIRAKLKGGSTTVSMVVEKCLEPNGNSSSSSSIVPPTPLTGGGNNKVEDPRIEELQEAVAKSAGRKPPLHAATLKRFRSFLKSYSVDDYVVTAEWCAVQNRSASEDKFKKPVGVLLLDDLNKFEGRLSQARAWKRNLPRRPIVRDVAGGERRPEVEFDDAATHRPQRTAAEIVQQEDVFGLIKAQCSTGGEK